MRKKINFSFLLMEVLPYIEILVLVGIVIFGLGHIYVNAQKALDASTLEEKYKASKTPDLTSTDSDIPLIASDFALFGTVTDADGNILYGPMLHSAGSAYDNIIGTVYSDSTRYVANAYRSELLSDCSILTGTRDTAASSTIRTTLVGPVQEEMTAFLEDNGIDGNIFAYNTTTGEIVCMASHHADSNAMNTNLYTTVPGSTMKIIALLLLEMQGIDYESLTFDCGGTYDLGEEDPIVCTKDHGKDLHVSDAVGMSCNIWFSKALAKLDWDQAKKDLESLGFTVNATTKPSASLGQMTYRSGEVTITGEADFRTLFGLCGENETLASPIQMAYITALICRGGKAAAPFLVYGDSTCEKISIDSKVCEKVRSVWQTAFDTYYKGLNSDIQYAKTGTAEIGTGAKRLLTGYTKSGYAFYIQIDNYRDQDGNMLGITHADVANTLVKCLQANMQTDN